MPRVSACISVLNQAQLLKGTIQSIVNQTFKDWECIVVDDGSTVSMKPVVDEFNDPRLIFHRFEVNKGIPYGANWAYQNSKGDYIQTLGCDEIISPTKFEDQVAYLDSHPEVSCIWGVHGNGPMGPVPEWEQNLRGAHNRSKEHWIKCFVNMEGIPIGGASAMWRRCLFDTIGYFDEKLAAFSDHEWFCRLFENYEGRILPFRWMNEIPGHKTICTRTEKNHEKWDWELAYVREKHPLIIPKTDGLITLAVPVHNHAKYLKEALDCALKQTDQNFEIIICDDGSTDDPESVVKTYQDPRISFFKNEKNLGCWDTINKLLDRAKGDLFVVLAADDKTEPTFLEKLRAEFIKDPFLEFVSTQNDFINESGGTEIPEYLNPLLHIPKATNRTVQDWWKTFRQGNIYFGIGMYRTSAVRELGGWEQKYGVIADYQMYLKLLPRYNLKIVEEPLIHTRVHGKNMSILDPKDKQNLRRQYYDAQLPFFQPRARVIIATPFYELKGFSPYIASLVEVIRHLTLSGIDWRFMELSGDSYVHRARNSMCMQFLDDPFATDLFFIDSDMAWDPQAFINILFRPEPIIGGTYPVKNKWELWTSKPMVVDPQKDPHFVGHNLDDGSSLIQANQLAGGFLRIKRSVLEKFMKFYPTHLYRDTNPDPHSRIDQIEFFTAGVNREPEILLLKEIERRMSESNGSGVKLDDLKPKFEELKTVREFVGEDYAFSNRLKAMDVPMFIYANATISHFGVRGWTGNFHETLKNMEAEAKGIKKEERILLSPGLL